MSQPLKTYLRTYRKRTCLTQDEVAFLLGAMCGTMVARHEHGQRIPMLENLLAYCIIFQAHPGDLYKGVQWKVRAIVARRARGLLHALERQPRTSRRDQKISHVQRLLQGLPNDAS